MVFSSKITKSILSYKMHDFWFMTYEWVSVESGKIDESLEICVIR